MKITDLIKRGYWGSGGAAVDPTLQYLIDNARALWTMEDGIDKTGNGWDLVGDTGVFTGGSVQTPDYRTHYNFDGTTSPMAYCTTGNIPLLAGGHETLLRGSHEFFIELKSGWFFSDAYILGVTSGKHIYYLQVLNTGKIRFSIRSRDAASSTVETNDAHFSNTGSNERRVYAKKLINIRIDFENDQFGMWINGGKVAVTVTGDALSNWQPNYYLGTNPFAFGSANVNNSTANFAATYFRNLGICAVTELLTNDQRYDITNYILSQ